MFRHGIDRYAESFLKTNPAALILLKEVEDPSRFWVAQIGENNKFIKLVEKPKQPPLKYTVVGVYFFKPSVFDAIKELKPSWRNELEITNAIQIMMSESLVGRHSRLVKEDSNMGFLGVNVSGHSEVFL
jgi:glucose-1-phosphate thymidylyltransferase